MIWDLTTIRQVRRLYVDGWIDEYYGHAVDATEAFQQHLTARLKFDAQEALAVEMDMRDVQFRDVTDQDDRNRGRRHVRGAWAPQTHEVQMRGGERDGQTFRWERIGDPLRFPKRQGASWYVRYDTYELSGWSESTRCWIYDENNGED